MGYHSGEWVVNLPVGLVVKHRRGMKIDRWRVWRRLLGLRAFAGAHKREGGARCSAFPPRGAGAVPEISDSFEAMKSLCFKLGGGSVEGKWRAMEGKGQGESAWKCNRKPTRFAEESLRPMVAERGDHPNGRPWVQWRRPVRSDWFLGF